MLSHHKRNIALKQTILRDIYVNNLKIAGKQSEDVEPGGRPSNRYKATVHFLRIIMVAFAVAISSFAYQTPPHQESEEGQSNRLSSAGADMEPSAVNAAIDIDLGIEPFVSESSRLLYQGPYWDWHKPADQSLNDFDLLLSSSEPVRLSTLFGLGVKTIVIDPGHGGRDPGAIGTNGTKEKYITLDVAIKLKSRLDALNSYNVLLTRENDRTLSLAERVEYAKANSADLFISIHVNSLPQKTVNLIETYYFGAPLTIDSLRLAEQENKASHFSVGELDTIIKDIGNTLKRQESASLAARIQKSLFSNMQYQDADILDSGIKMAPFVVLSQIEVPSVLVEISCLSKAEEEAKLALSSYREKVAAYMEEGIVSYLETQQLKIAKGENQNE